MKTLTEDWHDGVEYGFPMCCILAFVNAGGTANKTQALARGVVRNQGNPYVPCGFFHTPDFIPESDLEALRFGYYSGEVGYRLIQQEWSTEKGRYVDEAR